MKHRALNATVILGIIIIAIASAFAASKKVDTTPVTVATHTQTPEVTPTPEPTPTPSDPRFLELNNANAPLNGQDKGDAKFAILQSVSTDAKGITTIGLDEAYWLGGEEAIAAATKDYGCSKAKSTGPCDDNGKASLPNGFYIDNVTPKTLTYTLSADATIKLISLGYDKGYGLGIMTATPEELKAMLEKYPDMVAWFKADGTTITYLEEQYRP
jgi:hypothetical protein